MKSDILDNLRPKVRAIARKTAAYWPDTIEADDVEQELWTRILELSDDALERLDGSPHAGIMSTLHMMGMQVASRYRDDYELFSGNYRYSGDEVRRLLADGTLVFGDEATATERVDLYYGMSQLEQSSPQYYDVLLRRYAEGVSDRGDKDTLSRAVRALTREMNRSFNTRTAGHDGPALRKDQR